MPFAQDHDPAITVMNALLAAHPALQQEFPREIIDPNGPVIDQYRSGDYSDVVLQIRIDGAPYHLVYGWVKHEPYHYVTCETQRRIDEARGTV